MATRQAVNNTRATTPVSVPEITRIQVEGNDTVSFLYGLTPPYQWVRGMSQIMTQNPAYISYRYDTITISQVAGESFTFTIYSITDVGGNTFAALTSLDTADVVAAKTQEIYRLLVTSIFKGCCECGNTEPECSIQYTAGTDATVSGVFYDAGSNIRINYFTANNQDFTGFWPIIQDGSWIFVFSKTDPTVYGVYQLSNYSDGGGGTFAQFDATLLTGPAGFPDGTSLCVDVTSVGGSLVQDWQDTLNISSLLTQDNLVDGGGFNFEWENVNRYIINSFGYQSYITDDGAGSVGQVYIQPGGVTITGTNFIDVITPGWATATPGMVLALDASGHVEYTLAGTGTISSIGLFMPPAFTVSTPNPLIANGDFTVTGAGTDLEYINGLGELATLPVYTVENGLHAFGGVPGETPPDPFLFHLGGVLIEDTLITATEVLPGPTYNEWVLGVSGLVGQDTRQPFAVSNLGDGGVSVFADYGTGARPNPTVEMITDNDLSQPILNLHMQGDLPDANNTILRLRYSGRPDLATTTIDYQFRNNNAVAANSNFIGSRLSTEVVSFVDNNEETRFELQLIEGGALANKLEMQGYGQLVLNEYGLNVFSNGVSNIDNTLEYVLAVDASGNVYKKLSEGGGTVTEIDATGLLTTSPDPITTTGTVSSEMNSGFLVGRYDAGLGVFQEITVGAGLDLSAAGVLTADGSIPAYDGDQGVYKDTSLTNDTFMLGAPSGSQGTIPFTIDRYISVAGKRLQMEGTADVLKLIEGTAALASRSSTLEVTAENNYRAAQFTAVNTEAVRISTYGNVGGLVVENLASNTSYNSNFINEYGGGLDVKSKTDSRFWIYQASPNSINNVIDIQSVPSAGPYTAGQGTSITFQPGVDLGNNTIDNGTVLSSVFSDVTGSAAVVDFRIDTFNAGSPLIHSTFIGDGQLRLHEYGQTPANFPDAAPVWALGVDASGNVVEIDPGGGGGTYDGNQGIYKDTSLTNDTFMLGAPSGSQAGIAFSIDRYIDTTDQFLQIEGANGEDGSVVLKVIEGSGIPLDTKASFISATNYKKYAGSFTGHFSSALLAYSTAADGNTLEVTNVGNNGLAAIFQSDKGGGIQITSQSGSAFQINGGSSVTPAIYPILDLENLSNLSPAANGEGISITMSPGVDAFGTIDVGVSLNAVISDIGTIVGNDSVVDFRVDTLNLGTVQQHTSFIGSGQLQLHEYTTSTAFASGLTSIGVLNVDNTGKVFVGDGGGGGGIPFGVATGTDTYAVSAGTETTYTDGDAYLVRFTNGNTGGSTLNVNSIGAANMYSSSDGLLIGGDIWAGAQMLCVYNSSLPGFQCIGTSPNSLFAYVTNAEATAITKGMAVFAFGGTGDRLTVKKALATGDSTSAQTVGIVYSSSIGANQKGIIIIQGELVDLSLFPTSGGGENWTDGEPVYLSSTTAGAVTRVKQYAPNHLVYLGICVKASNGAAGRMYVRIQNGFELDELHNVQAQTPANKDTLWYDNTVTPKQWKTASVPSLSGTFSLGVTVDGSGGVITAGVKGYVRVPYACTINSWSILTNNSGVGATVTFDIWRANNAIPTVGTPLVGGGTKPFLTSNTAQITSATPTGWTSVTLAANDILGFNVQSGAAVFSWANLQLLVTKT